MTENDLSKTALHAQHTAAGATMGEEGGWATPISYRGALEEALEVRRRAGVFDVSHLGRIRIRGDGALDLLERVCTADVAHQEDDTTLHTLLCNEQGGILDECFLIRLANFWVLTCNAHNRQKLLDHLAEQKIDNMKIDDQTTMVSQLAVAGPAAEDILNEVLPIRLDGLKDHAAKMGSLMIANYIAARSGYSGEWTLEVMVPGMFATKAWDFITQSAGKNAIPPAGMAARDVLRIEAGLCRYGHETNETIDPITAGLERYVDFGHDFLGAEAIRKIQQKGPVQKRVGLIFEEPPAGKPSPPSIPVSGEVVRKTDGAEIGTITSGTFSPQQDNVIAMAYVVSDLAESGDEVLVGEHPARIVALPFYRRA